MSNPWGKFFWNDWESDPALRLCSLAAQGLWMRMLCICAKADPVGYLMVNGNSLNQDDLALLIGRPAADIVLLMDELSNRGVFSRDAKGRIYSRRMIRDGRNSVIAQNNGKKGGSPILCNAKENYNQLNLKDKPLLKDGVKPHSHKPIAIANSQLARAGNIKPENWEGEVLPADWHTYAEKLGVPDDQIYKSWRKFKEKSSSPWQFFRWKGWIDTEKFSH